MVLVANGAAWRWSSRVLQVRRDLPLILAAMLIAAGCGARAKEPAPRNHPVAGAKAQAYSIPAPIEVLASRLSDLRIAINDEVVVRVGMLCGVAVDAAQWESLLASKGYYVQRANLLGAMVALRFRRGDLFGDAFVYPAGSCQRAVVRVKVVTGGRTVRWGGASTIEWPPLVTGRDPSLYCYQPFSPDQELPFDSRQYEYGCAKARGVP